MLKLLVIGLLCALMTSPLWAFRCGYLLVTEGTLAHKVRAECNVVEDLLEWVFVEQDGKVYKIKVVNGKVNDID